jgi:hypothetical protein
MKADLWSWCLRIALIFSLAAIAQGAPENVERYEFREGEPLAYKTQVAVVVDTATESKYFEHSGKSKGKQNLTFDLEYQLMPIAHERFWKIRLVLDQVKWTINDDGEIETAIFDRAQLRSHGLSVGDMLNLNVWELGLSNKKEDGPDETDANTATNDLSLPPRIEKAQKVHVPEDLFERPILTWFAPDGTMQGFEDRSETQEIMAGLDLKECIRLLITPLPESEIRAGLSWSREEAVDLPEPTLKEQNFESMKWTLSYTIESVERVGERLCARIALRGRFAREGLWIPIRQQKRKYLIWTTMITKLQDRIDGEFLYDIEQKLMRASTVSNTYKYSTVEARKADNYRGQILSDHSLQTRITSALIDSAQEAPTRPGDSAAQAAPTKTGRSNPQAIGEMFATKTLDEPKKEADQELFTATIYP